MPETPSSIVIVGGGLAGAKAAEAARDQGYTGPITVLAKEDELPYERPPLSKDYLQGKAGFDDAITHDAAWYRDQDVTLRLGTEVAAVRPETHEVELADGARLDYGGLVLATGSEPAVPDIPGAADKIYLRTHADADRLRDALAKDSRVVIIGAGWIGLEVAAAARAAEAQVTLVESAEFPLLGVLGREMAAVFADLHRDHGVDLRLGAQVERIEDGAVVLVDGTQLPADVVVVATGATPNLDLAVTARLDVADGVLVDPALRTSEPDIVAVGDIAEQDHPVLGQRVRVEHWATALKQPATAVATLLGRAAPYEELPYFYSDQYDLGMEYVGLARPGSYARVIVRGDLAGREFVAFWLDAQDRVLAGMNVNVWDVVDDIKPLIAGKVVVDPGKLADPDVALTAVAV